MVLSIFTILGSLGLFLYGMKTMSAGIQKSAGDRLQKIMNYMTANRFASVFIGFSITALIQSSSATTVMIVSFVDAGLLTLNQAIGVIMGANIGTTVTGWLVAIIGFKFSISAFALPAVGIGLPLFFIKGLKQKDLGEVLIGFGILFLGLSFLKSSMPDIKNHPEVLEFLTHFTNRGFISYVIFILAGALITVLVQSSSAAMAITLTMAHAGWIDFPTSAAIILGENIGTTITAYLASLGSGVHARRAARAHTLFNLFGILWMSFLFVPFLTLVNLFVPGDVTSGLPDLIPSHLAMFHTLFNIANTALCIGFVPAFSKVVEALVRPKPGEIPKKYEMRYLSPATQSTPELYIVYARQEIEKMAAIIEDMFTRFLVVFESPNKKLGAEVEELKRLEDYTDQMQEQLSRFLASLAMDNINAQTAININSMVRTVHELESIGDSCYNLILLTQRRYDKKLVFPDVALEELKPFTDTVLEFIRFIRRHINRHLSSEEMEDALHLEEEIDQYRNILKKSARKRIQNGSYVKAELLYIDIVKHIEHIGDHSLNIADALRAVR